MNKGLEIANRFWLAPLLLSVILQLSIGCSGEETEPAPPQAPATTTVPTLAPAPTPTVAPTPTAEPTAAPTPAPAPTPTSVPTPTPTPTRTAVPTPIPTPKPTPTPTAVPTPTATPAPAPTATPAPTARPTPTAVPTAVPTPTPAPTPTLAPTPTPTLPPTPLETLFDEIIRKTEQREAFSEIKETNIGFKAIEDMKKLRSEFATAETELDLWFALVKLSNARRDRHLAVSPVDGGLPGPERQGCVSAPILVLPDLSDIDNPAFFVAAVGEGVNSPKVGDVIVGVNDRTIKEYVEEFTFWIRHSTLPGLYWQMSDDLPQRVSKPKSRWDVHLPEVGDQARSLAGGLRPLLAGRCGSGA